MSEGNVHLTLQIACQNREETPTLAQFVLWLQTVLSFVRRLKRNAQAAIPIRLQAIYYRNVELTIRLVEEDESLQLNTYYRGYQKTTNVLSFPFDPPSCSTVNLLGDLVICPAVVMHEAQVQHKLLEAHWAHLVVHGMLHLLGYDHQTESEALVMETVETHIIQTLGYPDPYAE